MSHYRLYVLDHTDQVVKAVDLVCVDDSDACLTASNFVDGHAVELWQSARMVARLPDTPSPSR